MTWTWTLTKFGISLGLGTISNNPVGWAIGIPTTTLIRIKSNEDLNSSVLTLSDKETAQRWIEISNDYQVGTGLGILGRGLGTIVSEMASETLSLGRQVGKEIAVHGFKTEVAKDLIFEGKILSIIEKSIRKINTLKKLGEKIKEGRDLIKELSEYSNEEEFIENIRNLIQVQISIINEIEEKLNKSPFSKELMKNSEEKNFLNDVRENVLELNKKNIKIYILNQKNKEEHRLINREINQLLKRIKDIQQKLHNDNNCCENCRFCQKG